MRLPDPTRIGYRIQLSDLPINMAVDTKVPVFVAGQFP
jgi:hypothetical protein